LYVLENLKNEVVKNYKNKTAVTTLLNILAAKIDSIHLKKHYFMKNLILLIFFTFSSIAMSAQETKKNQKAIIKTNIVCDHCKECETCGGNFQSNMLKIKGVKMYELDEKNMTITVFYNTQKTNLETIEGAISKMGYDANEIKADATGLGKLDDCCKKV
jgi:copper chaperone CopZ